MNIRALLRMSRWARNPPSEKRVKLVFGVIILCLAIIALEWMGWWPEWAKTDPKLLR